MSSRPLPLLLVCLGFAAAACGDSDKTLKVTGIEPERGDINGDTYVMIKGNRFVADGPRKADVYFGTQQSGYRKGSVVRFASDKQLIVRTPGGKPGEVVDVLVMFEPGGQLRIPNAFTYVEKGGGMSVDDLAPGKDKGGEKRSAPKK
ncbi:MAG TPA: IPT/TIG domain-containing protein [Kofleriaceae bacterium]|nr:IPT/TIG domain-containing protein [Kofleriaceae bacterium]